MCIRDRNNTLPRVIVPIASKLVIAPISGDNDPSIIPTIVVMKSIIAGLLFSTAFINFTNLDVV